MQATSNLSLDIATFYNKLLKSSHCGAGTPRVEGSSRSDDIVIPFVAANKMSGGTYGV